MTNANEQKFTPGPWTVKDEHPERACVHIVSQTPRDELATVYLWKDEEDEQMANARLIAAAPTFYAGAVKSYRKGHHDTCSNALGAVYECDCGFVEFAAAIAKAESK